MVRRLPSFVFGLLALVMASSLATGVATSGAVSKKPIILSGDAVGAVRFGETESRAAASLVKLIGTPEGGVRKVNEGYCIISAALYWSNFAVFFYHGTFDGYQTGNSLTDKPVPRFNAVTPKGLRVGDTLAEARRLYGRALTTNGVQGGVYAVVSTTGTIRGYLSSEPNQAPASNVRLLSISAGSVGCPAMSPG